MKVFFCGASEEIGASCIYLNIDGKKIVLDSGIRMNQDPLPEFRVIQENGGFDCIIVSHAHMDHTGSLPVISKENSTAPIFMTHPTRDITRTLLHDSLKIMKTKEDDIPTFAEADVLNMLNQIKCFNFQYTFKPFEDSEIEVTFYQAGHIAGAACIFIKGKEGSLFYTGDFASVPQRTVGGANIPRLRPDILITESTYGDKLHSNRKTEENKLIEMVKDVVERGGKILIPAFAVGRAQEVILILKNAVATKLLPEIPIYVDGMVKEICKIYKNYPNYLKEKLAKTIWKSNDAFFSKNVIAVDNHDLRNQIIEKDEPCCVISSSGMLTGGYSVFYAEHFAKSEKNYIAITGYQDEESPGRKLLDMTNAKKSERYMILPNKSFPILCDFGKYNLSAHGDKNEILGVIEKLQPRKLFLIHGSKQVLINLGQEVSKQKTERKREIYIPRNGDSFEFEFDNPIKKSNLQTVKSLNKEYELNKDNILELWEYLVLQNKKLIGYTIEDILFYWFGKNDIEEKIFLEVQELINKSKYFKKNPRKLFIFIPVEEINSKKTKKNTSDIKTLEAMEQNELRIFSEKFFIPEMGLYKTGFRVDEKIALLSFNYPNLIKNKYQEKIKEFEELTKWKAEINKECNISTANNFITDIFGDNSDIKISYYKNDNKFKVVLDNKPENENEICKDFLEKTGIDLEVSYPQKIYLEIKKEVIDIEENYFTPRVNQNSALDFIENILSRNEHKVYKKSIKEENGKKYIEISFITPIIGQKYLNQIEDLEKELGYRIKIAKSYNQIEVIQKATRLLKQQGVIVKKTPGFFEAEHKVKVKMNSEDYIMKDVWEKLQNDFFEQTGFTLERS